jgi:hypothetical protein
MRGAKRGGTAGETEAPSAKWSADASSARIGKTKHADGASALQGGICAPVKISCDRSGRIPLYDNERVNPVKQSIETKSL